MNIKKLLALILVIVIAISVFAGCNIIIKNEERDYSQALAVIEYNGLTAEVTKGEFYESFNSYAYYYVYYYGYTVEETADLILDSLAQRELLLLYVRDEMAKAQGVSNTVAIEDLLTAVEKNEAIKSTNETMKSFYDEIYEELWSEVHLDDDETTTDDEEEESEALEPRATRPEVAEAEIDYNAQLTDDEKEEKFFDKADNDESFLYGDDYTDEQKSYVKKAIAQLKKELADNYKSYEYYLEGSYESELLSKYQRSFGSAYVKANATEAILAKYNEYVKLNKEAFANNTESAYQSAIADLTTLAYTPASETGYGYVYNILFKFSDAQSTAITNYAKDQANEEAVTAYRDNLANSIITHQSNLDYDADAKEGEENSNAYIMDGDKEKEFNAIDVLMGNEAKGITGLYEILGSASLFDEKLEQVKQYTYMYNDDSGMFDSDNDNAITNNNLGYLITPEGKTSSYVDEFTELGRALIAGTPSADIIAKYNIEGTGLGAYGYCVTDYGIHFMFVSYVVTDACKEDVADVNTDLDKIVEYKDARDTLATNKTLSDVIFDSLKETFSTNQYQIDAQSFINSHKDDCITKQSKVWKKMMKELNEAYNS